MKYKTDLEQAHHKYTEYELKMKKKFEEKAHRYTLLHTNFEEHKIKYKTDLEHANHKYAEYE